MNPNDPQARPQQEAFNNPPQYSQPQQAQSEQAQSPQPQPVPQQQPQPPQMVYVTRPINPTEPHITEEARARHEASKKRFPSLNLSDGEYVISAVKRHPIGLVPILGFVGLMVVLCAMSVPLYASQASTDSNSVMMVTAMAGLIGLLFLIGGYIATYVYTHNKFFLTNESVIQEIQTSLFAKHEQTVSLANIEDASFQQHGIFQHLFNYGNIRLSTEGDETTYRFSFVANPKKEIATLNNAVEAFKNGRPVGDD